MGVPKWHYIRALQNFAHALAYNDSAKKARQLNEETSEEVLKQFILEKKEKISDKEFYYLAGRATQCTIDEADEMGIDYKDEDEVKTAYNFVKGENGELSDDLLESASGGKGYAEYKGDQVYKNNKGDYVVKK